MNTKITISVSQTITFMYYFMSEYSLKITSRFNSKCVKIKSNSIYFLNGTKLPQNEIQPLFCLSENGYIFDTDKIYAAKNQKHNEKIVFSNKKLWKEAR